MKFEYIPKKDAINWSGYIVNEDKFYRFVDEFNIIGVVWSQPQTISASYFLRLLQNGSSEKARGYGRRSLENDEYSNQLQPYYMPLFEHGALWKKRDGSVICTAMPYGDKESVTVSFNKMVKEFGFPETIKMEFLDNRYRYRPNGDIMIIMRDDYRNYLFEHYLSVVNRYRPKVFVFENVPGILSAAPDGTPITDLIKQGFANIGYDIIGDLKITKVNASDYGVPQNRERMIIVGIDNRKYKNTQRMLNTFYKEILPKYKVTKKITVKEAIGDLPACEPFYDEEHHKKRKSHTVPELNITWHKPRYHNLRDMDTFRILAKDIESGKREYNSKKISELYEKKVGSKSPIHRYHVLEPDLPSTTIIAHLYKDGNRFIHYDSKQCRSITVREAARLQSFDDDFDFVGAQGNAYQMIGNAVPPQLAKRVALALGEMLDEID